MSQTNDPNSNLVLHINGGLGKCIMATTVIKNYKLQFPKAKVVVVSGYPEVFLHNPDVYRNFKFETPYLWVDYYGNPDWKVFAQDPYLEPAWIKNNPKHLTQIWTEMLGAAYKQKTPLLYFSSAEVDELQRMIQVDKPLIVVQSTGGSIPSARSWTRNPPHDEFEAYLAKHLDKNYILHVCLPDTPVLQNVNQRVENMDRRKAMALFYYANEVVGIDSYSLHARAANPDAGASTFFFPLAETVERLAYPGTKQKYKTPRKEVQDMLRNHQDYYATVFKLGIEDVSENCPIPPGMKWFD